MGLLEQIAADVAAIKTQLAAMHQAGIVQPAPAPAPAPVDPAAAQRAELERQLAALNGGTATQGVQTQPTAAAVTSDQLMALITPHLDNAATKEALGAEMRAAGINALPEAQPHQYADLYTRFQRVIAAAGTTASAGSASII